MQPLASCCGRFLVTNKGWPVEIIPAKRRAYLEIATVSGGDGSFLGGGMIAPSPFPFRFPHHAFNPAAVPQLQIVLSIPPAALYTLNRGARVAPEPRWT